MGIWELPTGWEIARLGDLVDMKTGFACAKRNLVSEGISHLRPFNIGTNGEIDFSTVYQIPEDYRAGVDQYDLEPGHILFNNTNSVELVGKTALVREPLHTAFSNHITRLTANNVGRANPAYVALTLRQLWNRGYFAANCNRWIGQAGFNTKMLAEVEIPLPEIEVQRHIAARVEALFAELAEARRLHNVSEKDTKELLNGAIEQAVDEMYAKAPEIVALADFADVFNGRASGSGKSDVRVFKTKHVYPFTLKQKEPSYMKPEQVAKLPTNRYLQSGDVLVCNIARGTLGRVCHVDEAQDNWTTDTQVMILRTNERCLGKWLFYYLYSRRGQAEILAREKGIAFADKRGQTHLYPKDMKTVSIPLPSIAEQRHIVAYLNDVQTQVSALRRTQETTASELERLEQAILMQAFQGEL